MNVTEHPAREPFEIEALRHRMARRLMHEIFSGRLTADSKLAVQKIARQYGISATPVREALLDLASLGIVRFEHNRGARVEPFGPGQLRDIYTMRRILEAEAARQATGKIEPAKLQQLRQALEALLDDVDADDPGDWSRREMATDRHLHGLIAEHCGNARLSREITRYSAIVQTVRDTLEEDLTAQRSAVRDHLRIIEALEAGQGPAAAAAMAEHIDHAYDYAAPRIFDEAEEADARHPAVVSYA